MKDETQSTHGSGRGKGDELSSKGVDRLRMCRKSVVKTGEVGKTLNSQVFYFPGSGYNFLILFKDNY